MAESVHPHAPTRAARRERLGDSTGAGHDDPRSPDQPSRRPRLDQDAQPDRLRASDGRRTCGMIATTCPMDRAKVKPHPIAARSSGLGDSHERISFRRSSHLRGWPRELSPFNQPTGTLSSSKEALDQLGVTKCGDTRRRSWPYLSYQSQYSLVRARGNLSQARGPSGSDRRPWSTISDPPRTCLSRASK